MEKISNPGIFYSLIDRITPLIQNFPFVMKFFPQSLGNLLVSCLSVLTLQAMIPSAAAMPMTDLMATNDIAVPVVYGTNDPSIQMFVPFLPKDLKPGEKRPALVLIHGGAWHAPGTTYFYPMAKYFASRGVPTFCIEYRSVEQPQFASVGEILEDCRSAMRTIRTHASEYGVDPDKIAVLGDSAGGHLAACLGTIPDEKNATLSSKSNLMILCNPIVDMTDPAWIKFVIGGKALGHNPAPEDLAPTLEQQKLAHELSPQFFISPQTAPALIMHGLDDTIVPPAQSQRFADTMKKACLEQELILIPNARHAFILPKYTATEQQVIDAILHAEKFLAKHGYVTGEPTLVSSSPPAWEPKVKPAPKPLTSPSPDTH